MQELPRLSDEDLFFYRSTLYQFIQNGPMSVKPGAEMMRVLQSEVTRSMKESPEIPEYTAVVGELYKVVTDSLVSAAHRSAPHELINRTRCEYHVVTDEEEYQFHEEEDMLDEDDVDTETDSNGDTNSNIKGTDQNPKQRKREEARRKRKEEEDMLINEKKVTDEKGRPYRTLGPHPEPRLTVRASTDIFPSRKTLQQRTIVETPSPSSSSSDEDEDALNKVAVSSSSEAREALTHLTSFLQPLSIDSLKKVSESAKAKLKPSSPHGEFVSQIVKTAVRLGWEKACVLMDKQKLFDDAMSRMQTGTLPTTGTMEFLNTLPEGSLQLLGTVLGLPDTNPPADDVWERMVAMGFLSVLTNLRLKPLKKIANELKIGVPETNSTEKYCEGVVFAAFPRERIRARLSKAKQKKVKFCVRRDKMYTKGDMGFITFEIWNISNLSVLAKESERHYSPEFYYADLKWSLLCMNNKDSLALYLCQTGSVHCKFIITVVNHLNADDSICNEGTQSFSTTCQENDWGFNNVIKFSDLTNPSQGFVDPADDSITIEVGVVLVEPIKTNAREKSVPAASTPAAGNAAGANAGGGGGGGGGKKKKNDSPRVDQEAMRQLLEDERAENNRKKVRQEIGKTIRDEEKSRKEMMQHANKLFHDLQDRLRQDTKRIQKEEVDRVKKEEQAIQKDAELIRQAAQQHDELKESIETLRADSSQLQQEKQNLTQSAKDLKKSHEKATQELKNVQKKIQSMQQDATGTEKKLAVLRRKRDTLLGNEPASPSPSLSEEDEPEEDDNDMDNGDDIMQENIDRFLADDLDA